MPDWFFDPGAVGTASGSSAADAFTNCNSWFALQNSASGLLAIDRVWFRRTSQASMVPSSAQWGRQGWTALNPFGWLIGWPKSGEPFHSSRPIDGRSAGWDSDVNTYVNTDINMAVWAHSSDPHPSAPPIGMGMANFCFNQVGGVSRLRVNTSEHNPKRNIHYLNTAFTGLNNFDDVFITASQNIMIQTPFNGGRITLTASTVVNTGIVSENMVFCINELVTLTNSYRALHGNNLNGNTEARRAEINVWRGNEPNQGLINAANNRWNSVPIVIYDCFGKGPVFMSGGGFAPALSTPLSADARVNSAPLLSTIDIITQAGGNYRATAARFYGHPNQANADARAFISVTSGIPVHVRWPIMTTNSLVANPAITGVPIEMIVQGPGGRTVSANSLLAGAVSSWAGNSVSAGSAWVAEFNWTPPETRTHYLDLMVGVSPGFVGKAYIGNPLVSSS